MKKISGERVPWWIQYRTELITFFHTDEGFSSYLREHHLRIDEHLNMVWG